MLEHKRTGGQVSPWTGSGVGRWTDVAHVHLPGRRQLCMWGWARWREFPPAVILTTQQKPAAQGGVIRREEKSTRSVWDVCEQKGRSIDFAYQQPHMTVALRSHRATPPTSLAPSLLGLKMKTDISRCLACDLSLVLRKISLRPLPTISPSSSCTKLPRDTTELAAALLIHEAEPAHSLIFCSRIGCARLTVMKICICQIIKLI